MVRINKHFGFKTLGPFYAMTKLFGLLLVKETDNKVTCSKKDRGSNGTGDVFSPDKRYLVYSAVLTVWFYWTASRCVELVGGWSCGDGDGDDGTDVSCSSAVEWIVAAACAAQAATAVVVAAVHRPSRTAELLNCARDVLTRGGGGGADECEATGAAAAARTSHVAVGAWYAAAATAIVSARSAAVIAARPDRFAVADVLALCVPAAAVSVAVECAIVCVCAATEDAGHAAVSRLRRLAADVANAPRGPHAAATRLVHWRLERVWRDHWRGCLLVDRLSRCYGLDLAVNLTASMLIFIVYAYVTMMSVYHTFVTGERPVTLAAVYWNLALTCQLACVSFRIVFISYRAERIKQVNWFKVNRKMWMGYMNFVHLKASNSVLISLRNLLKQKNLDISTIMLINSFTYQIMNKELKVSACGFFSVNLSFFHALIRLATTYLIVIIQFNASPSQ